MLKTFDAVIMIENYMDMKEWDNFWKAFTHVNKKAAKMLPFTSDVGFDIYDISGYINPELAKNMALNPYLQAVMDEMIMAFIDSHLEDGERLYTLEHEDKKYEVAFLLNSPQEYILLSEGKNDFFTEEDFEFFQNRADDDEVINEVRLVYTAFIEALEHFNLADKFCSILNDDVKNIIKQGKELVYTHFQEIFEDEEFLKELEDDNLSDDEKGLKVIDLAYNMLLEDMLEMVEDIVPSEWTIGKRVKYEFQPNLLELS